MKTLTIYKSSAGSGKTYTLVREFLKLVLKNPESYRNILAVTFTNKATDEMKQRIISTLVELTENKNHSLAEDLCNELKKTPTQLKLDADAVLKKLLHNYSKFSIQTIDSFFNKTIRALARELKLPLQFEMEMNQGYVQACIVEQLLADIGVNSFLTRQLETFVLSKIDEDKGWNVEYALMQIASELFKENFRSQQSGKKINDDFIKKLHSIKTDFEVEMKKIGEEFLNILNDHNLEIADLMGGKNGVGNYFYKIKEAEDYKAFIPGSTVNKVYETNQWVAKTSAKKELITDLANAFFNDLLQKAFAVNEKKFKNYCTALALLKLCYVASIVDLLDEQLKKYRDENELLLMSDVNQVIAHFISQSDTPFIYEKTGNRYQHFLIDEFQDTSDFQWGNFLPLIENAMSMGFQSLVVGDVKQSIYRWRGGNMKLLYKKIYDDLINYKSIVETKNLNTNYRSKKNVVEFNNALFSNAPQTLQEFLNEEHRPLLIDTYSAKDVSQLVAAKNNEGGYVCVELLDAERFPDVDTSAYGRNNTWKAVALHRMIETIKDLIQRGFALGDIAILVRRNSDGYEVANCLFENGFDKVITPDSLLLKGNIQISLLINALKFLNDNTDEVAKAAVLHVYLYLNNTSAAISEHQLFSDSSNQFANLFDKINSLQQKHLYDIAEELVNLFGLNKKSDAFVQRFLDVVLDFTEKNPATVGNFIMWWNENSESDKCSVVISESTDAIHILSIHKSKGLQYTVVIMPFIDWDINPKPTEIIWATTDESPFNEISKHPVNATSLLSETHFNQQYENEISQSLIDNINMLYVAFTRAEQQLYLFAPKVKTDNKDKASRSSLVFTLLLKANEKWLSQIESDRALLEIGEREKKQIKSAEPKQNLKSLSQFNFNNWTEKLDVKIKAERTDEFKAQFEKREAGMLMHEVLAKIITTTDLNAAIESTIQNSINDNDLKKELTTKVNTIFNLCADKKWFDGSCQIKNEVEIVMPDASIKRPDRLIFNDNEVTILDYKTGVKEKSYSRQVDEYANALSDMGYKVTGKYLLYLESVELIEV